MPLIHINLHLSMDYLPAIINNLFLNNGWMCVGGGRPGKVHFRYFSCQNGNSLPVSEYSDLHCKREGQVWGEPQLDILSEGPVSLRSRLFPLTYTSGSKTAINHSHARTQHLPSYSTINPFCLYLLPVNVVLWVSRVPFILLQCDFGWF